MTKKDIKTELGNEDILDEKRLFLLLLEYQDDTLHHKVRKQKKEEIIIGLFPIATSLAWKYQNANLELLEEDLFQIGIEKIIKMIDLWSPERKGTIGGFFRIGVENQFKSIYTRTKKRYLDTTSYEEDSLGDSSVYSVHSYESIVDIKRLRRVGEGIFTGDDLEAYNISIMWILSLRGSYSKLQQYLRQKFGFTYQDAALILNHAIISIRIETISKTPLYTRDEALLESSKTSLFSRLCLLLEDNKDNNYSFNQILTLFQGMNIKIPGIKIDVQEVGNG